MFSPRYSTSAINTFTGLNIIVQQPFSVYFYFLKEKILNNIVFVVCRKLFRVWLTPVVSYLPSEFRIDALINREIPTAALARAYLGAQIWPGGGKLIWPPFRRYVFKADPDPDRNMYPYSSIFLPRDGPGTMACTRTLGWPKKILHSVIAGKWWVR